jgi:hypothetical protein
MGACCHRESDLVACDGCERRVPSNCLNRDGLCIVCIGDLMDGAA